MKEDPKMHPFWRPVRLYIVLLLTVVVPLIAASRSLAQGETMVVATWGGAYTDAFREAFAGPFSEETGVEVQIVDAPGGYNAMLEAQAEDRKSTRLNSSHANISYAVFCLKKKIIIP